MKCRPLLHGLYISLLRFDLLIDLLIDLLFSEQRALLLLLLLLLLMLLERRQILVDSFLLVLKGAGFLFGSSLSLLRWFYLLCWPYLL